MKLGILTCMWKRPGVFEIFATGINRLKKKFDIITLSVGSEGQESMDLCRKHSINYLSYYNKPLGAKFNTGMRAMQGYDPDYVMILGSDDLISDDTVQRIIGLCEKGHDVIGFTDLWFYDLIKKQLLYWPGYGNRGTKADSDRKGEAIGLGRTLSRNILNKMNWQPWKADIDMGLDWWMTQKLRSLNIKPKVFNLKENNLFAIDMKSNENICKINLFKIDIADDILLDKHLSIGEVNLIKRYGI